HIYTESPVYSFSFNDHATTDNYTLSLHDALPISKKLQSELNKQFDKNLKVDGIWGTKTKQSIAAIKYGAKGKLTKTLQAALYLRSEEHTSELQSRFDLVCRLLLEKKKT